MSTSYFDPKFQTLKNKISSKCDNEEILKCFRNMPTKVTMENLPFVTMKLFQVLDYTIDRTTNFKVNIKRQNQHDNDTNNSTYFLKDDSQSNTDHHVVLKEEQVATLTNNNSTIHHMPKQVLDVTLSFFDEPALEMMLKIRNSLIQKIVSGHLEQNFISSSMLELDLRQQNKLQKFIIRKISKYNITHLVFKCKSLFDIGIAEKTQMIEAAKTCNRLEIMEVDALTTIFTKGIFHKTVNEMSQAI